MLGMRAVLQRVKSATVTVDGIVISSIGPGDSQDGCLLEHRGLQTDIPCPPGLVALIGIHQEDTEKDADYL